jgi:hypothetical protein
VNTCTWPVGVAGDPCRKPATCYFVVGGERYYRCKRHDSRSARATAEDRGYQRFPIDEPQMAGDLRDFPA